MSTILLVDDEYPAIEAIRTRVDWRRLGIDRVLTADCVEAARELFAKYKIELLLCDIEMPAENGLDLLQWTRTWSPETVGVFLTCHADFGYAKDAVRMGAFDYLLKPASIEDIETVLEKALKEWEKRQNSAAWENLWRKNAATVLERFWWDILNDLMPGSRERIAQQVRDKNLPIRMEGDYLLASCVIRRWNLDLSVWEKYDLDFTVRNVLAEVYCDAAPWLITDTTNRKLILFDGGEKQTFDVEGVTASAERFLDFMKRYFKTEACFYIGNPCKIEELAQTYEDLCRREKNNVSYDGRIFFCRAERPAGGGEISGRQDQEQWRALLTAGKGQELCAQLKRNLRKLAAQEALNAETLLLFYHDVLQVVYSVLAEYNISARELLHNYEEEYEEALGSREKMEQHLEHIIQTSVGYMESVKHQEGVVGEVKKYIEEHLAEDLSRDTLAGLVYLNPNYLARLFRSKTGYSLVDYITKQKIARVEKLLLTTELSVTQIAQQAGYTNMPYFSKVFKKETGCTPVEYRRNGGKEAR